MTFAAPWFLIGLVALPLLAWAYVAAQRGRGQAMAAFVSAPLRASVAPWRPGWRRHVPIAFFALAIALLLVALARPQATVAVPAERATIMLVTDHSGSMQAADVAPNRLTAARRAAASFLERVPGRVRVGAVVFNQRAQLAQSPTTDREQVRAVLAGLRPAGGTATGDALDVALRALDTPRNGERRGRPPAAIVLLSDGKATSGRDPIALARQARSLRIPVYTVALGTPSGTIRARDRPGAPLRTKRVPPDTQTLKRIAQLSGGRAFAVEDAGELDGVYRRLGSQVATRPERREITAWLAGGALALLLGGGGASLRWFARPA